MSFKLEIITPRGLYLTKEVDSLTVKLTSGYRTILAKHTPLIGCLDYAPMHINSNSKIDYYAVHGGAINISNEKVVLLVGAIEHAKDIDVARAKAAKERAEKRLLDKNDIDIKRAQLALLRAISRIKTADHN